MTQRRKKEEVVLTRGEAKLERSMVKAEKQGLEKKLKKKDEDNSFRADILTRTEKPIVSSHGFPSLPPFRFDSSESLPSSNILYLTEFIHPFPVILC